MSLWQTASTDESSCSDDELSIDSCNSDGDTIQFSNGFSGRETEKALRRETNSPFVNSAASLTTRLNRLKSIFHDSKFVQNISATFPGLPLVANERCGRWYILPERYHSSAYFKSTDGHYGNWSFSTRRLNLDFLRTVVKHGGYSCPNVGVDGRAILVDSTRRGKRMPDALSKTVPIWCAVINRFVSQKWTETVFPLDVVSEQEISSIDGLIPSFVDSFKNCGIDSTLISSLLDKPLRPIFICPESSLDIDLSDEYYPVVLLTASKCVANGHDRISEFVYIQGAADDEESWTRGLNSAQFWQNYNELLACTQEDELVEVISEIVRKSSPMRTMQADCSRIGATNICLGVSCGKREVPTIVCGHGVGEVLQETSTLNLSSPAKSKLLTVMVRQVFPAAVSFALKHGILTNTSLLVVATDPSRQLLDLSIAITLVLLCLFFDDQGIVKDRRHDQMTKELIRRRLTWIITARGHQVERVSRQTLIIVNTYLMSSSNLVQK